MGWVSVHQPVRPQWICAGCGAPWPCRTRKR
ncbi:flavin reductase, partial [Micromonospora costi]